MPHTTHVRIPTLINKFIRNIQTKLRRSHVLHPNSHERCLVHNIKKSLEYRPYTFPEAIAYVYYRMWNVLLLDDRKLQYIVHVGT